MNAPMPMPMIAPATVMRVWERTKSRKSAPAKETKPEISMNGFRPILSESQPERSASTISAPPRIIFRLP